MPPSAPADTLDAFARLTVWARGGERAPHKPLLVLLVLGRWANGDPAPVRFADIERPLRDLLAEFGPTRRSYHPEFPFWHLQSDGVWELDPPPRFPPRKGHTAPSARQLRESPVRGTFTGPVRAAFARTPALVPAVAHRLLDAHFPPSVHEDILAAVGLDPAAGRSSARPRDPAFREAVLAAYGYACAVCGLGVRLGTVPVTVEAAHVRWHSAGGPDVPANGLCLCPLHHKLFDRGVFTLTTDTARLVVSARANGAGLHEPLLRFHDRPIRRPSRRDELPAAEHVRWHRAEVFHHLERDVTDDEGGPEGQIP